MTHLRLLGALAIVAAVAFSAWSIWERFRLADVVADVRACEAAAPKPDASLDRCRAPIALQIEAARQAAICDAAIGRRDLYVIRAACGEHAKRAVAERDAGETSLAVARAQLAGANTGRDVAVARAEARAAQLTQRTATDARTIAQAPRRADGRVHCDADCLRALAGSAPAPGR